MGRIQAEIKQKKPFASAEEEAFLNLQRTGHALEAGLAALLRAHRLTRPQYNVLRILRGAGLAGLTAGEVAERMITRDPDVTRLLDRMEARGLVERWRCGHDRRVVWTRITAAGVEAAGALDAPVQALHRRQLGHLGPERLQALIRLLEEARTAPG